VRQALIPVVAVPLFLATAVAQQATFKVSVDLVAVDVLVTAHGAPIAGLSASDFEITDNKVAQKVERVSDTLQPIPLDLMMVFDTSQSVAGDKLAQLKDAGKAVLATLRPGDRSALITFNQQTVVRQRLSPDVSAVARAVERLNAAGRTSLFDALYTGLSLRRTPDTRAMVLVFSDGRDNGSWLSGSQVAQVARESDVVVYAVGLDNGIKREMQGIAEETGGAVVVAQSASALKTLFTRIVREMQARYVIYYYPTGVTGSGWHATEVRVPGRRVEIVARRGYWRR